MNRGEKDRANNCLAEIRRMGIGEEAIRYIIANLAKSSEGCSPRNRGEMDRANACIVMIGRYGFCGEAKEYIIAELTKSIEKPQQKEKKTGDEE